MTCRARLIGHGETDAFIAIGAADDGGVDADQPAFGVHQRAAGIARIDGGIRLDEILVMRVGIGFVERETAAPQPADDAHGDGLAHAEGIADGQYDVADLQLIELSPNVMAGKSWASIFNTATSVGGSVPMTLAVYFLSPPATLTLISSAP